MAKKKEVEGRLKLGQELWVVPCDINAYRRYNPDKVFPMFCTVVEGGGDNYIFKVSGFDCEFNDEDMSASEFHYYDDDNGYDSGDDGTLYAYETPQEAKDYIDSYWLAIEARKSLSKVPVELSVTQLRRIIGIINEDEEVTVLTDIDNLKLKITEIINGK